jgi:hypothetical protein
MATKKASYLLPQRSFAKLNFLCQCALLNAAFLYSTANVLAQGTSSREYVIKAGYLYNFIKYIDWPNSKDTITIGVFGDNPFGPALAPLNGKTAKGRRVVVKQLDSLRNAQDCQIIFVSSSENRRLREIFENATSEHVLTVGEVEGFAQSGGVINFIGENNKVHFEINAGAARRAGLTISSELLKLAKLVKS